MPHTGSEQIQGGDLPGNPGSRLLAIWIRIFSKHLFRCSSGCQWSIAIMHGGIGRLEGFTKKETSL